MEQTGATCTKLGMTWSGAQAEETSRRCVTSGNFVTAVINSKNNWSAYNYEHYRLTNTASNFEAFECDLAHGRFTALRFSIHSIFQRICVVQCSSDGRVSSPVRPNERSIVNALVTQFRDFVSKVREFAIK